MIPTGRLTVLNTLIKPKLNHVVLALPMPNDAFLRSFYLMFECLRNSKIHKVKQEMLVKHLSHHFLKHLWKNECKWIFNSKYTVIIGMAMQMIFFDK